MWYDERYDTKDAILYFHSHRSRQHYQRFRVARENWIKGCRSIGSVLYNATEAADSSRVYRKALFSLIGDGTIENQRNPAFDCQGG